MPVPLISTVLGSSLIVPSPLAALRSEVPQLAARLRVLPPLAVLGLALAGVAVLLFGARARRPLAVLGGAAVGYVAAMLAPSWVSTNSGIPLDTLRPLAAGLLAAGGALFPPLFVAATGALLGASISSAFDVIGSSAMMVAVGAAIGGIGALFMARWMAAVVSATMGAVLLSASMLACGSFWPMMRLLSERPFTVIAITAVMIVTGTAFQIRNAWPSQQGFKLGRGGGGLPPRQEPAVMEK